MVACCRREDIDRNKEDGTATNLGATMSAPQALRSNCRDEEDENPLALEQETPVTVPSNVNLTEQEKELLRWHQRLGHVSMHRVKWMMRQGMLSTTERTRRLY